MSSANIPSSGSTTSPFGRTPIAMVLLLLLLAPSLVPATCGADLGEAETASLIQKLKEHRAKFPSLTADFSEQKTSRLLQKPLVMNGTIAFTAPDHFRREVRGKSPSTTVCDGKQLWIYYPSFNEAEHYTLGQRSFFDDSIAALTAGLNFARIEDYYRYTAAREDKGYRLTLRPKTGGLKRMLKELSVTVTEDFLIAGTETVSPKDDRVVTTYSNQKAQALPASTFEFKPPADAKVTTPLGK